MITSASPGKHLHHGTAQRPYFGAGLAAPQADIKPATRARECGGRLKTWLTLGACIAGLAACSSSDVEGRTDIRPGAGVLSGGGLATTGGVAASGGFGETGGFTSTTGGMSSPGTGGTRPTGCSSAEIVPEVSRSPGNLLVLFDRSTSMRDDFGAGTRFEAVDTALREGLRQFVCPPDVVDGPVCNETLTVGSLLFPSIPLALDCVAESVDPLEATTQISWKPVSEFLNAWDAFWAPGISLFPGTPIESAFQRGAEAITASTLAGTTAVLFLTDGASTCWTRPVDPIAQAGTWLNEGIKTYVVSVAPGQAGFNDQVAQAGGSGASINPTDIQQLKNAIGDIIQETAVVSTCKTTLSGKEVTDIAGACMRGTVTMEGSRVPCDPQNGFQITSKTEMELFGVACDDLLAGKALTANFPCDVLLE